jgi:hypothetical protein
MKSEKKRNVSRNNTSRRPRISSSKEKKKRKCARTRESEERGEGRRAALRGSSLAPYRPCSRTGRAKSTRSVQYCAVPRVNPMHPRVSEPGAFHVHTPHSSMLKIMWIQNFTTKIKTGVYLRIDN